jgi:cytochrome c biogenesis protein CcdA
MTALPRAVVVAVALAALGSIVTSGCSRIPAATSTLRAEAEQLELPPACRTDRGRPDRLPWHSGEPEDGPPRAGRRNPGGAGFRALLGARGLGEVFLAGLFTGLLPCGLLYGMLALAASTRDVVQGLVAMVAFGLGTVPAMAAAGLGGSLLGLAARRRLHSVAAWCLVLTGLISIARGVGHVSFSQAPPSGCPFCEPAR